MRARARVVADAGTGPAGDVRLTTVRSEAPLLLRAGAGALWLVGGAAGPLGGDDLVLEVVVGVGARLCIRTTAASVLLPGPGGWGSRFLVVASVAAGGLLEWLPEPSVAAAGCRHRASARIELAVGAGLVWREELVLGRSGESPGSWSGRVSVDVGGIPLHRHELRLGPDAPGWDGPAVVADAGAVGTLLVVDGAGRCGHGDVARRVGPGAAVFPLGPGAGLVSAVAATAGGLRAGLDAGRDLMSAVPTAGTVSGW